MSRRCKRCDCPLMLAQGETRRLCERCRCSDMSKVQKQRRANRLSYVVNRDERLAKRRERRLNDGDAIRAADRERYAAKKGGTVRPYNRKGPPARETPSTP